MQTGKALSNCIDESQRISFAACPHPRHRNRRGRSIASATVVGLRYLGYVLPPISDGDPYFFILLVACVCVRVRVRNIAEMKIVAVLATSRAPVSFFPLRSAKKRRANACGYRGLRNALSDMCARAKVRERGRRNKMSTSATESQ